QKRIRESFPHLPSESIGREKMRIEPRLRLRKSRSSRHGRSRLFHRQGSIFPECLRHCGQQIFRVAIVIAVAWTAYGPDKKSTQVAFAEDVVDFPRGRFRIVIGDKTNSSGGLD